MRVLRRRRLTCRQLTEIVTDYLEAALSSRDGAHFERHVAGCAGCRVYLGQMRRTIRLLGRLAASGRLG